ncbi:MAG: hypothetical protein LBG45_08290 [Dysgonamonadaceae bacterium]|nr:hypothetical protein [Dysgonamonadaceae bacterium]
MTVNKVSSLRDLAEMEPHSDRKLKHTVNKVSSLRDLAGRQPFSPQALAYGLLQHGVSRRDTELIVTCYLFFIPELMPPSKKDPGSGFSSPIFKNVPEGRNKFVISIENYQLCDENK